MANQGYAKCIEACNACTMACNHCATSCLREADIKTSAWCIALALDCGAICQLAAAAMAQGSESAPVFCRLCTEISQLCADECAKQEAPHRQACAMDCLNCADECSRIWELQLESPPQGFTPHVTACATDVNIWILYRALGEPLSTLDGLSPLEAVIAGNAGEAVQAVFGVLGLDSNRAHAAKVGEGR